MKLTPEFIKEITQPGVYIMRRQDEVLYVGMSSSGGNRFLSSSHKMRPYLLNGEVDIEFIATADAVAADALETQLIGELNPIFNIAKTQVHSDRDRENLQRNKRRMNKETKRLKPAVISQMTKEKREMGIIGKYCHSYPNGQLTWQGKVLYEVENGTFLVQLYEFILGFPSNQILVPLSQMKQDNWTFFEDREEWVHACNDWNLRHFPQESSDAPPSEQEEESSSVREVR